MSRTKFNFVTDKVHKHFCGYANFSDLKTLLEQNKLWNDIAYQYVSQIVSECTACHTTAPIQPSRNVSIHTSSQAFNENVFADHMFLDNEKLVQFMDKVPRYSTPHIVDTMSTDNVVYGYEALWIGLFWISKYIVGDKAFFNIVFP